jgi:uncharacterized membrane protein
MKSRIAVLAVSVAAVAGLFAAPSAMAGGEFCYDVNVQVQDQTVAQAGCVPIG